MGVGSLDLFEGQADSLSTIDSLNERLLNPAFQPPISFHSQAVIAIDQGIGDWRFLADQAEALGDVVILNAHQGGVEQLSNYFQERAAHGADPITQFSLISHGRSGAIQLGNSWLTSDTLDQYRDALASWTTRFSSDADLLVWGCDVADGINGQSLVNSLASATGLDVAASTNRTTNPWMGGDVTLEYCSGSINADAQHPLASLLGTNLAEALAVTATLSDGDLLISSTARGDVLAEIASDGTNYTVSGTGLAATQFAIASVTGRIKVDDPVGIDNNMFRVTSGAALANALMVTNSVETTELIAGIEATMPGDVYIGSASVQLGSALSTGQWLGVSTSATDGDVELPGTVTLKYDTEIRSGSGLIRLGSVAAPSSSALFLSLGDANQTGAVTVTGNVNLPVGFVFTGSGAFDVSLQGATNSIAAVEIRNQGVLRIGQAGGTSTFRDGLVATTPAAVSLAGVVETVDARISVGNVTLRADTTLRSGSGEIQTGAVTDGAAAFTLSLGSDGQTGEITLEGSVTIDDLTTAAGHFGVKLLGNQNDITQQVTFTNTFSVALGDNTNDISRFAGGVTATSQTASNLLIGTVRTAGGTINIRRGYLTGLTTLDTSDDGAVASGAPITLRDGARLESHVLTTIGGVGASAQGTYILGTGSFGSGSTNTGSLEVQAGSLFIGEGAAVGAAIAVANDTRMRVAAGSLAVGASATIDASGRSLTLQADDITIASAAGSIDAARVSLAPATAGRNVFLATTGTGLVLSTDVIQAIDADTIQIGEAGYSGRVTLGALTLADTTLAVVADGTGGSVALNGAFTSTGTPVSGFGLQITGSGATTVLDANITSTGDVFIDDAVELAAATVTIATSGGGDVTITGGTKGIWSTKGEANSLVVTAETGGVSLATGTGFGDQGGTADLVRDVTVTAGSALLGTGNVIAGNLSISAPQVTLAAVVYAAGAIRVDNGAGGPAAVVIAGNTVLDSTQDGKIPAGNSVTVQGTVTTNSANNYFFKIKAGTAGDVLVTGRIGSGDSGPALGTVSIAGNDVTVASIDGLNQGLSLEAADAPGGVDPGSVTLTGTTYRSTTSAGIAVGSRDSTNALGSAENRITLAGGVAGATTSFVTRGFSVEFGGNVDLAGRNLTIDTTGGGVAPAGSFIYLNDSIDGAGTLTLDGGTAGELAVNHLGGETGGATPLTGITVANAKGAGFGRGLRAGTVRIVNATDTVTFAGVLDITGEFVTEARPYRVTLLGGGAGSSRIAGTTTFHNTGRVQFGDEGPPDVITFAGGLVATAPAEVGLTATILADSGSIVLGDADTRVSVTGAVIGGAAASITLADVDLLNAPLVLGTGRANTIRVGSVTGTAEGSSDEFVVDTTGTVTMTGGVGSGVDDLQVVRSAGTTFEGAVAAGVVVLSDTAGTVVFQGAVTVPTLDTSADRVTLPQTITPGDTLARTLQVKDGIVSGSGLVDNLAFTAAATLEVTATGIQPGSGYGQFTVASQGTVELGSATLALTGSALPTGSILKIIDNGGSNAVVGTFADLPEGSLIDSPLGVCRISYVGGDGNDVTVEAVTRDIVVSMDNDLLLVRLAGTDTTVRNLSTQYLPASRRLVLTVAADRPLTGGGAGLTVNRRAGTVTVDLAQQPQFRGILVRGTGAADQITLGPRGVNLAALTAGTPSQVFVIVTGSGADVVTLRSPVRTKGPDGGIVVEAATINLGATVDTQLGLQRYRGHTQLVGNTILKGGAIGFDRTLNGAQRLTVNATGTVGFLDAVGGETPLRGIEIQRAASVDFSLGLRLDGRGLGSAANGLVIGSGVDNVLLSSEDPSLRPCTISRFGGNGILFRGGSKGSLIRGVNFDDNGQGITFLPGDYQGTTVASNTIRGSRRAGVTLEKSTNLNIGGVLLGDGNQIEGSLVRRLSGKGIVARGILTGTRISGNTINRNSSGIVLQDAKGVMVGSAGMSNTVTNNSAWGLLATGNCENSVLDTSGISANMPGNVNVVRARKLVIDPPG